jgi:DNA adenine methylase
MNLSLCRYVGGKTKLARPIINRITESTIETYREPFVGGGSVGLNLLVDAAISNAWINDLDVGVYCMWRAAAKYPEMLKEELRNFVPSVPEFDRIKALFLSGIAVPSSPEATVRIAAQKIALQQMSYSGLGQMASGPQGGRAQTNGGIDSRWNVDGICQRIDLLSPLLKEVRITSLDFSALILDQRRATVYLDPPYVDVGKKLYQHSLSDADHVLLSELLRCSDHDWWLSPQRL